MKITILDAQTLGDDVDLSIFEKHGEVTRYAKTAPGETVERIGSSAIVITNKVVINKAVMDACANLRLICIAATGMNNVDLEYAEKKGIRVTNVAGYSTKSVAQHTFSMLFYLLEKMGYYDGFVKEGHWEESRLFTNVSRPFYEISGKKWGIIGMGAIGREVAKIATAFGAHVQYYSTSGQNSDQPYNRVELERLMETSSVVSVHAPLNDRTKDLLGQSELELLPKGAVVLNLGRGGIINEEDLAKVVDQKEIYAGLDVTTKEPLPNGSALMRVQNKQRLLITPHIAWTSVEARNLLLEGIEQNIIDFKRDHTL